MLMLIFGLFGFHQFLLVYKICELVDMFRRFHMINFKLARFIFPFGCCKCLSTCEILEEKDLRDCEATVHNTSVCHTLRLAAPI